MPTQTNQTKWLILIALVAAVVYVNALGGEFVYDDKRQIVMNPLIQEPSLFGKALTTDVWAFKGDGSIATSNYWRPTFTAWCIINYWLFGANPFGWHVLNILLHVGICLLAYLLLRRWGASDTVSLAITLIFAVHPVHTESVAWVSGSPDLLFGLSFLASIWFLRDAASLRDRILSVLFYVLALGSKEIALVCFPVYCLILCRKHDIKTAMLKTSPYALAAVSFFFVRWAVLGTISRPAEDAMGFASAVLTAPSVFAFYLRQIVFPYWIGPNYPIREVSSIAILNFIVPLVISLAAIFCLWRLAKRSFVQKIGLVLFILPLLSVFNLNAFLSEQLVHDRYLYISLLGFLMMTVPFLDSVLAKISKKPLLTTLTVVVTVLLAVQTVAYNRVWLKELALWRHAVLIDPGSSFNWSGLGSELSEQGKIDESIGAYGNSLNIRTRPLALIGRAQGLVKRKQIDPAIDDLKTVIAMPPERVDVYALYQAYEALAVALQDKNDLEGAAKALQEASERMPIYRASLAAKLAVVHYQQGKKGEALSELEGVKDQARRELLPASKAVFLRLGMLYAELGKKDEARNYLREYLAATERAQDKVTPEERQEAKELLQNLR